MFDNNINNTWLSSSIWSNPDIDILFKSLNTNNAVLKDFEKSILKLPPTRKSRSQTAIKYLRTAYQSQNLSLVLGAGISMRYGLPVWNELLQKLLIKTFEDTPEKSIVISKLFTLLFNPSPLIAGRYLQSSLVDKSDLHRFENEVRTALYESYTPEVTSSIMDEIIKFCVAPGNSPNLDSIITYNYDDIIETKLKEKDIDIPFQCIFGQGINPENKSLPIYHVHGYLPRVGKINEQNSITLGEYIYHEQYNKLYSWNNIVQINKFREKTCLFIGISLNDPNIRRLLDIANSQKNSNNYHYILKKNIDKTLIRSQLDKLLTENTNLFDDKLRANLNLDETVDFLTEIKKRFDEKDSESLGVKTVWIDDYEEDISSILKKIREI